MCIHPRLSFALRISSPIFSWEVLLYAYDNNTGKCSGVQELKWDRQMADMKHTYVFACFGV